MVGELKHALPDGHRLEDYVLVGVLGEGGFSVTYLAEDINLRNKVAIKEYLPNEFAMRDGTDVFAKSPATREDFEWGLKRFLEEARVLARLRHPNIVRVVRRFEANNTAYIVMDYEDGAPLGELLKHHGTLSEEKLKELLLPLADGLKYVHAEGFLHRDIKPDNIFVRRSDETPVLLDFGAARNAVVQRSKSMGAIVAAGYSPPEQYETEGEQGPPSDIYALSALCYRATVGVRPVDSPRRVRMLYTTGQDPLPSMLASVGDSYSSALCNAVDWGLSPKSADRPRDIEEWLEAVRGAIPDQISPSHGAIRERASAAEKGELQHVSKRTQGWVRGALLGGALLAGVVLVVALVALGPINHKAMLNDAVPEIDTATPDSETRTDQPPPPPVRYGTLTVDLSPADSALVIPGISAPYQPRMRIREGDYVLTARRDGYATESREFNVSGDTVLQVRLQRETPPTAPFTVVVEPSEARIRILNIEPRYSSGMDLGPGEYRVEVSAPGFVTKTDDVEHGSEPTVHRVTLTVGGPFRDCDTCPWMVWMNSGNFVMGSNQESGRYPDEGPTRKVSFATRFAIGVTEVTFDDWDECALDGGCSEYLPPDEDWGRGGRPVINVSWEDAQRYTTWLSSRSGGLTYRLPSEAEWEYSARAGTATPTYWGESSSQCGYANGADVTAREAYGQALRWPVASCDDGHAYTAFVDDDRFMPNERGLRHVLGNAAEWTEDCWHGSYRKAPSDGSAWIEDCENSDGQVMRVVRGGDWSSPPRNVRAAFRGQMQESGRSAIVGFRVVRSGMQ